LSAAVGGSYSTSYIYDGVATVALFCDNFMANHEINIRNRTARGCVDVREGAKSAKHIEDGTGSFKLFKRPLPGFFNNFNPLNAELNPICYLLALLAHHFLHVNRIRVKSLTLRLLMSYIYIYIYIYGAPILDVSRSHTTTQHSR